MNHTHDHSAHEGMDMGSGGMDMSSGGHGSMNHAGMGRLSFTCDGSDWTGMGSDRPGSWSSNVAPGVVCLLWATHWTFNVFKSYLTSSKNSPYSKQTTYSVLGWQAVEGVLKIFIPFLFIVVELWWGHGHFSTNVCPSGTKRAGHFAITHLHLYQNSWNLFCFMVAGIVDVASHYIELPSNTQHAMTAAAFALQAFSLNQAQYADMLDGMVYYLQYMSVAATAGCMMLETVLPEAFWLGAAKCYSMWLQAVWYFCCARILHEGRPAWDSMQPAPDMGPAMYVPVVYVLWMNILSVTLLSVYLGMRWWYGAHLNEHLRSHCTVERTLVPEDGLSTPGKGFSSSKDGRTGNHELVPLVSKLGHAY